MSTSGGDEQKQSTQVNTDPTAKDYYFDSYSHHGIHEEMLKDEVRTRSYMNAIERNPHIFEGKIVLDVGCGTGILSMFAARAGASHVYAVECSAIVGKCRQIVEANGFSDTITVIQGKMEEVDLPVQRVDIIISEWMGYCLLYESMLDSVLFARDKFLHPDNGIMLPDKAVLYLCAIEDADYRKTKLDFWESVYGFNMSCMKAVAQTEPLVDVVDSDAVLSDCQPVLVLDILRCKKEDLSFEASFKLRVNRNDYCHAFVAYFDYGFTQIHKPIFVSTSPHAATTHWKQTVFYIPTPLTVSAGESIEGTLRCCPNALNPRDIDIHIAYSFEGKIMQARGCSQSYKLR